MPEKRFEKELQEDMASLKFHPTDEVWQRIAVDLRRKKRRRALAFFSAMVGIGILMSTGYYLYHHINNDPVYAVVDKEAQKLNAAENSNETVAEKNNANDTKNVNDEHGEVSEADKTVKEQQSRPDKRTATLPLDHNADRFKGGDANGMVQIPAESSTPSLPLSRKPLPRTKLPKSNAKLPSLAVTPETPLPGSNIQNPVASNTSALPGTQNPAPIARTAVPDSQDPLSGSLKGLLQGIDTAAFNPPVSNPSMAIAKASRKKIIWGLSLSGGITGHTDHLPSLQKSQIESDPLFSNAPPGSGQAAAPVISPSSITLGAAWKVGVTASYPISKRAQLTAGLQYARLSTRINVGAEKDVDVSFDAINAQPIVTNALYRGAQTRPYTNHYNFLQLPISYELQLNRSKATRINWTVSLVPAYLIGTNALVYDTAFGGSYYNSLKTLKRFHLGLGTGLNIGFGKPGKLQWSIGPDFFIDLRSITRPSFGPKQYLINGGITARFFLPRKK